jgi:hypothetical protein
LELLEELLPTDERELLPLLPADERELLVYELPLLRLDDEPLLYEPPLLYVPRLLYVPLLLYEFPPRERVVPVAPVLF